MEQTLEGMEGTIECTERQTRAPTQQNDLFLIEAIIKDISVNLAEKNDLTLTIQFGTSYALTIQTSDAGISDGKSCLFPYNIEEFLDIVKEGDIELLVKSQSNGLQLGISVAPWPAPFLKLITDHWKQRRDKSGPCIVTETYNFVTTEDENVGHVTLNLRLMIFGGQIQTPFSQTESMSYLIKGETNAPAFRIQRGQSATSHEIFPIAHVGTRLPSKELLPQTFPPDHYSNKLLEKTKSEIEELLCGKHTCPGVIKFKDFGIGPLAKPPPTPPPFEESESEESVFRIEIPDEPCESGVCPFRDIEAKSMSTQSPEVIEKLIAPCGIPTCGRTKTLVINLPKKPVGPCGNPDCPYAFHSANDKIENHIICQARSCRPDIKAIRRRLEGPLPEGFKAICEECGGLSKSGKTCIDLIVQAGSDLKQDIIAPDNAKILSNVFAAIAEVVRSKDIGKLDESISKLYFKHLEPLTSCCENRKFLNRFLETSLNIVPALFQISTVSPAALLLNGLINQTLLSIVALHSRKCRPKSNDPDKKPSETSLSNLSMATLDQFLQMFCNESAAMLFEIISVLIGLKDELKIEDTVTEFYEFLDGTISRCKVEDRVKMDCFQIANNIVKIFETKLPKWLQPDTLKCVIVSVYIMYKDYDKSIYYELPESIAGFEIGIMNILMQNFTKPPTELNLKCANDLKANAKENFVLFYVHTTTHLFQYLYNVLNGAPPVMESLIEDPNEAKNEMELKISITAETICNKVMEYLHITVKWYTEESIASFQKCIKAMIKTTVDKISDGFECGSILNQTVVDIHFPKSPIDNIFLKFYSTSDLFMLKLIVENFTSLKRISKSDNTKDLVHSYFSMCLSFTRMMLPYFINLGIDIYDLVSGIPVSIRAVKNSDTIAEDFKQQIALLSNMIVEYFVKEFDMPETIIKLVNVLLCVYLQKTVKQIMSLQKRQAGNKAERLSKKFVYYGDTYPGVKLGHKVCVVQGRPVPANMGWLWNVPPVGRLKQRRGWRPGKIANTVNNLMKGIREKKKNDIPKRSVFKSEWNPNPPKEPEYVVEDKPTLHIRKKEGVFYITMYPLKNPYNVDENEDPYINCTPMTFTISRKCDLPAPKPSEEDDWGDEPSDVESEIDIEFTTPAGLIEMERMKKKPNIENSESQYRKSDFDPTALDDCKSKKSGKGKGKKGKKGKK